MTVATVAPGLGRGVLIGAIILGMAVTGCQNGGGAGGVGPRAALGGLGAAAGGGLIASAAGGDARVIAASVILAGLIGGAIGERLDQRDRQLANETAQRAFERTPAGQPATWRNPDSGASGSVTPTRTFQAANGGYCREFQQEIVVGGERQQSFGTACRQPNGQWRIVS